MIYVKNLQSKLAADDHELINEINDRINSSPLSTLSEKTYQEFKPGRTMLMGRRKRKKFMSAGGLQLEEYPAVKEEEIGIYEGVLQRLKCLVIHKQFLQDKSYDGSNIEINSDDNKHRMGIDRYYKDIADSMDSIACIKPSIGINTISIFGILYIALRQFDIQSGLTIGAYFQIIKRLSVHIRRLPEMILPDWRRLFELEKHPGYCAFTAPDYLFQNSFVIRSSIARIQSLLSIDLPIINIRNRIYENLEFFNKNPQLYQYGIDVLKLFTTMNHDTEKDHSGNAIPLFLLTLFS